MSDLQITGLTKTFGSTEVLKDLNLTVREGEFLTLLGSSGCGKSTLLRLIAGLDEPTAGSIRMGEQDLLALSPSHRNCAMVFQSYALYPHMTVLANICTPLFMRGLGFWGRLPGAQWVSGDVRRKRAQAVQSATAVAAKLGIEALLHRKPAQLSGGQRQRVALARAMVRHPSVFLFDEPLSNLDANLRQTLRAEIRKLHDELGVTFIYVTHDQHEAMSMSDRIAVMREGKVLQLATPQEIYDAPANLDVARFVGAPRINVLPADVYTDGGVWAQGRHIGHADRPAGAASVAFRPQSGGFEDEGGLQIRGVVESVEYTGAEVVLALRVSGTPDPCVFCLPSSGPTTHVGDSVCVYVALAHIHLFDASGQRCTWRSTPVTAEELV